ncbi:NADH-quinone oxidoreductase subunit N [Mucilaginibacter sp. HMF5004]|uniref:NADH-quinone oxidoreductase subunit N n=1 Tax=Mucilaginibacter rivuli TaxID=2857527 RepID=UPI001C5CF5B5|nr:NADH-quinone oxidoreductase subunit N [Mucilaginibacter rivuli]MBW4889644.1 NADH-quinone oxidoreductase subunit N [Mucilaginibacter rivuli]
MNNLIHHIPAQLDDILKSMPWFVPELGLSILFLIVFLADLIAGKKMAGLARTVSIIGMLVVLFTALQQLPLVPVGESHFVFNGMLLLHRTSVCFKLVIDALAILVLIYIPWDKALRAHFKGLGDLYSIIIASVLGLHLMLMAVNLLSIYLAVEMVSIASYLMVAYRSDTQTTTEAGMKYVLFGAVASAIMLYGISLLYGFSGTLDIFADSFIQNLIHVSPLSVSLALVLVMVGIGFKLSFVPMHFWVPDVYQGAATPVTAYLSTLPKIAGLGMLINFLTPFVFSTSWAAFDFRLLLSVVGVITLIVGNIAAIWQTNIKRLLAYSSIGHTGFALMALVTFSEQGISALLFYLAVYAIANIGALMLCSYYVNKIGAHTLDSYKGVGLRYPLPSVCFVMILISLAGLPVSAGFNGKLLVFSAVYDVYQHSPNVWLLALLITGAATTVIALFYYIKIPLYLFLKKNDHHADDLIVNHKYLLIFICVISAFLLLTGVFPQMLNFLQL